MARTKRTIVALLFVIAGYWAYEFVAVPAIEPDVTLRAAQTQAPPAPQPRDTSLDHLFPPGSWELERPKVLETDYGTLIFGDYQPIGDNQIKLDRCTLVCYPRKRPEQSGDADARPIILRTERGAVLYFDGGLNIARGQFGRLSGGHLPGMIKISSPASAPGADDELDLTTHNIQIDERKVWTPHPVTFRYGRNSGSGADLAIHFHPPAVRKKSEEDKSPLGKLKALELRRVEKVELYVPTNELSSVGQSPSTTEDAAPIEIRCQGSLRFDFDDNMLSLNEHVDVVRHNINGPSDQLNCEQLQLRFAAKNQPVSTDEGEAESPGMPRLVPSKLVALGYPVMLKAPSVGAEVRAAEIEYELATRRVRLLDDQGVLLRDRRFEVAAREVEYEVHPDGRLGRLYANGPGRASGLLGAQQRRFEANFNGEIRLQPVENDHVLSITGGFSSRLGSPFGQDDDSFADFSAEELHLFLREVPQDDGSGRFTLVPDRMKAMNDVRVDSPQLSGSLAEANIWFRQPGAEPPDDAAPTVFDRQGSQTSDQSDSKVHLVARRLNAEVILSDPPQVSRLGVEGEVECRQVTPAAEPMSILCDSFELEGGETQNPRAVFAGRPARVQLRGSSVVGNTIDIEQGRNLLTIPGAGEMTLPARRTGNRTLPPVRVQWTGEMQFNGSRARLSGDVRAEGAQQKASGDVLQFQVLGETLDLTLNHAVNFADPEIRDDINLRDLAFRGTADLHTWSFGADRAQKSADRMQLRDLQLDQSTGRIQAAGPGWLSSVHTSRKDLLPQGFQSRSEPTGQQKLSYLRVDFQRELVGNLHQRESEFRGDVQCIYGPVSSWDATIEPSRVTQLGEHDIVLACQRLAVADMSEATGIAESLEMEATHNALVRGQLFSASGQRIAYTRAKDQLIVEGDRRNDAQLTYRKHPGAAPTPLRAGRVVFWPSTKQFEFNNFRSVDANDVSQLRQPGQGSRSR